MYDFTLQFKDSEHIVPSGADIGDRCWGQTEDNWNALTKPLWRLALLLIEVTLGTIVFSVESNESGAISYVSFEEANSQSQTSSRRVTRYSLDKLLKDKIQTAARRSRSYVKAVKYCATKVGPEASANEGTIKKYLSDFYFNTVVP